MSCYSDDFPPELESLVVMQVDRVDHAGIWGTLVDWGLDRCTAYLPIGSIGKEKGRGERKAQMHFLTRARRSASKSSFDRMKFAAYVQSIDTLSRNGVADSHRGDISAQRFHVTVTRREITNEIEKAGIMLSKDIQHCARRLVDKAAAVAGVSPHWARKVTMHAAYERALIDEANEEPEKAPVTFLLKTIGANPASPVADLLGSVTQERVMEDKVKSFAAHLLHLCREENQRRSKPVTVSVSAVIGGPNIAMQSIRGPSPTVCDTYHLLAAFRAARVVTPPQGCEEAAVTVKGGGKFTLTTAALPDLESRAEEYLGALTANFRDTWLRSSCSAEASLLDYHKEAEGTLGSLQPTLSIGVIGDVANGKSTLVKAISGKKTQSHTSEQQQHGITIRLGFANASVIRCQNMEDICGAYSFLPESLDAGNDTNLPKCSKCGHSTNVIRRFSLVDCPGHAELMATMLAGASAFDAVLLAAASNVACPTPQARQHLEAVELSGAMDETRSRSIAVLQTKAELLADDSKNLQSKLSPEERLEYHARHGREKMKKLAAGKAPVFPVCATLGLGLEAVAEWVANLPPGGSQQHTQHTPHLKVLRSFDVNRPGHPAKDLEGGVLGGTIQRGGCISLGDILEIRPGLCLPKEAASPFEKAKKSQEDKKEKADPDGARQGVNPDLFHVQPLRFRCMSLMTGKNQLSSASKGGLVAVGTSLDPAICAGNRMVGSVAGPPGTLPPVWGPTLYMDKLRFVDLPPEYSAEKSKGSSVTPSDFLKKCAEIRCHIGSATVKGRVIRFSYKHGKVEVRLTRPVCAARGANIALEGTGCNAHCLVAHARLAGGDVCLEGAEEDEASSNGKSITKDSEENEEQSTPGNDLIERDVHFRKLFLDDLESCKDSKTDGGASRLSVPRADIARDGGAHVLLSNFGAIAHALRRETWHLVMYLHKEGGLSCAVAGDRTSPATTMLRVKWRGGRNFAERFASILKKYIRAYVTCNQCRGAVTELLGAGMTEQLCRLCNARRFVPKLS